MTVLSIIPELNPLWLVAAVVEEHDHFVELDKEPGAERWITNCRKYRPLLFDAVISRWCSISKLKDECFPYSDDCVIRLWTCYRKMTTDRKRDLQQALHTGGLSVAHPLFS